MKFDLSLPALLNHQIEEALPLQERRVFALMWEGKKIWVKRAVPSKIKSAHVWQKLLGWINPILRPTVCKGGEESLKAEAIRLKNLAAAGLHVPAVIGGTPQWLILEDIGDTLTTFLDHEPILQRRFDFISKAGQALATLHHQGHYCGSGLLRDMTWNGSWFGFIDAEEDPGQVMPLATAQARNMILFLLSAVRYLEAEDGVLEKLGIFLWQAEPLAVQQALKKLKHYYWFLSHLPISSHRLGRDLRHAVKVGQALFHTTHKACTI